MAEAAGGYVKLGLSGTTADQSQQKLCEDIVARLPGVKSVANELRTMAGGLYRFPSQVKDKG